MNPNLPFYMFLLMAFSAILAFKFMLFFYFKHTGQLHGWRYLYFLSSIFTIWFIWQSASGIIKIAGG